LLKKILEQTFEMDLSLIKRFDKTGPRYTSYPTADRFTTDYNEIDYCRNILDLNQQEANKSYSLYLHLPFCRTLCFYCACNKIVTRSELKAKNYLNYLKQEISMQSSLFKDKVEIEQMHWGGGTPTYYEMDELDNLFKHVKKHFNLYKNAECAIEIDPRTVDREKIFALQKMGFNRISLGIQDFNIEVQKAINRIQSEEQTLKIFHAAREAGFESVNVDLIYGLPLQTEENFRKTINVIIQAKPDRIAIYNYAHMPTKVKSQKKILNSDLPDSNKKLALLWMATELLRASGYLHIGMDHFALAQDSLSIAQKEGKLQRNFQGYSTGSGQDLIGIGVSSISQIGSHYIQNHRNLEEYYARLDQGHLPIFRGIKLNTDDLLRRELIQSLMCHFIVSKHNLEITYPINFDDYFSKELNILNEMEKNGLVELESDWISVTTKGRFLIRNIAMVFDIHQSIVTGQEKFSKLI
jgi:oxygen-independent coproporphyrinogen-3 oxidase